MLVRVVFLSALTLTLLSPWRPCCGKNVLLLPSMIHSHVLELMAIGEGLVRKGHQVVIAMHKGELIRAHTEIRIIFYGTDEESGVHLGLYSNDLVKSIESGIKFDSKNFINQASSVLCQSILKDRSFHEQLRSMKFDFGIVDGFLPSRCLYIIPQKLKIPYASVTSHIPIDLMGSMLSLPSIHANVYYNNQRTPRMNFMSRVRNTVDMISYSFMVWFNYEPSDYHQHYHYKSLSDLANQSQLWIINSDPFIDNAYPTLPHVVYAGGLTATRNKQPMSDGLRKFVDDGLHGVIIVSFGSLLPQLPERISRKFLNVFARLKQHVVWRHTENLNDIPNNVRIENWIPQLSLLEHKNTRMLISHCGGTGQYEAVFFGIPMIGFPLFLNHEGYARKMVERKIGIGMSMSDFSEEDLYTAISEILHNPTYTSNVRQLGQMLRDRPTTLKDVAIYWVDHVIKYGGSHLRSPVADLDWKQLILLDVTAFMVMILLSACLVLYIFVSCVCRKFWSSKMINVAVRRRRQHSVSKMKTS